MNKLLTLGSLLTLSLLSTSPVLQAATTSASSYVQRPAVQDFIKSMVKKHNFKKQDLHKWFNSVPPRDDLIEAIKHPAEAKPWHQYRKIFLVERRIKGGVEFWKKHRATLQRAEQETGVPARIIVAILGVETLYNKYKGKHAVMESLTTLAFGYPKRSKFFTRELEHFLLLAREENVDPLSLKGSYAGAMGGPQFISSSYRHYAIDFDGDGKRDIWNNPADMIGSVANYFKRHHWQRNQPVTFRAEVKGTQYKNFIKKNPKPVHNMAMLNKNGISSKSVNDPNVKASLIKLDNTNGVEYWLGLQNFYVITRYNHSQLYAMAVNQLSEEISQRMQAN